MLGTVQIIALVVALLTSRPVHDLRQRPWRVGARNLEEGRLGYPANCKWTKTITPQLLTGQIYPTIRQLKQIAPQSPYRTNLSKS
jgi:hypothetical protein